jgi:SapC
MTTQLLIYKTAVPVSRARHANWFVETRPNYAFSGEVNSVPLMAVEFPQAAAEYAIVFAGTDGEILPAVILGVRGEENLFIDHNSQWGAKYIPAFVRRYPFVFSRSGDRFLLCVDEEFPGINQEGRGQPMFAADGTPSPYLDNVLKFLQEYQAQFLRTQRFCARIKELDLLEPMQAQVTVENGRRLSLGGFMAINRDKLKALPGDKLAELIKTDELELIFLHIQSMRNFEHLRERLALAGTEATQQAASPEPRDAAHATANGVVQVH